MKKGHRGERGTLRRRLLLSNSEIRNSEEEGDCGKKKIVGGRLFLYLVVVAREPSVKKTAKLVSTF